MKKIFPILIVVGLILASCSTTAPIAGATGKVGPKTGEAKQKWLFGLPLKGEGGIQAAANNGGIKTVGTVDVRIDWPASPVIPYHVVTTVVTGE
ncbi:hypothetical protein DWQ65_10475 [Treponema phagedenis]|uniref:Lipoprotein n=1 Tax=Treponema phagedenis TaxID=162 RepID=A0A0B7GXT4_TREPH|nr:TRL domain-containing protein [Treponema phagedenis]EFW38999.1 hypothetical protein HMPREF9554_00492 [Treponema phagedenis F0421]QEJ96176.1 hypothetical protein FUT79_13860 [Treponema phagedenis]QEJ99442.1 hypothetical protein FUT82_16565 [Treponema phagedenis]QEJ99877.1 hypothetical protein FUT84_00920 [Treponema phagedenis]QEK07410.1 hypothetical protein FUT80_12230 [Treponema phagedenis]